MLPLSQAEDLEEQSRGIRNDKAVRPPIVCERLLSMEEQGQWGYKNTIGSYLFTA